MFRAGLLSPLSPIVKIFLTLPRSRYGTLTPHTLAETREAGDLAWARTWCLLRFTLSTLLRPGVNL